MCNLMEGTLKFTSSVKFTPWWFCKRHILYRPELQKAVKSMGCEVSSLFRSIIFWSCSKLTGGYSRKRLKLWQIVLKRCLYKVYCMIRTVIFDNIAPFRISYGRAYFQFHSPAAKSFVWLWSPWSRSHGSCLRVGLDVSNPDRNYDDILYFLSRKIFLTFVFVSASLRFARETLGRPLRMARALSTQFRLTAIFVFVAGKRGRGAQQSAVTRSRSKQTHEVKMKIKRAKKVNKILNFYANNFGFRKPYQILVDGTLCFFALKASLFSLIILFCAIIILDYKKLIWFCTCMCTLFLCVLIKIIVFQNKINLNDQLPKYFGAEIKLLTTACVIIETEKLGKKLLDLTLI